MFQKTLAGPLGRGLVRDAHAAPARRAVYGWTVNEAAWMEWSIERGLDGVITDDPALFRDVCDRWEDVLDGLRPRERTPVRRRARMLADLVAFNVLASAVLLVFLATGRYYWRPLLRVGQKPAR